MLRKLMVVIVLVLALLPATVLAQDIAPLNYCTTVESHQETGLATYEVNAAGSGRWARIVQYPVANPAVVIVVRDFGAGATVYQFQHLALSGVLQYQVQMSHTSATSGFSTTGCVFAPAPLLNQLSVQATCIPAPYGVLIEWQMSSQVGVYHYVAEQNGHEIFDIPADCPGCMTGAEYSYMHVTDTPNGAYRLRTGVEAQVVDVICQVPTAVHLASLKAQTEPPVPTDNITLEFLGTLAGAALATWLTVNMVVKSIPNWKAKIVAIPAAIFWTVGASVLLAYPDVTAATVFLALANSLLVYFTATGGATMLAARAAEPKRAMANGEEPFNKAWW